MTTTQWMVLAGALVAAQPVAVRAEAPGSGRDAAAAGPAGAGGVEAPEGAPGSPRAAMGQFLRDARAGDYAAAARWLDLPAARAGEGPALARQLRAVLDRHLWIDPEDLSPAPEGNLADGLPPDRERLGQIAIAGEPPEPVTLVRRVVGGEARWLVSRATLAHLPDWYGSLGTRWAVEHMPPALQRPGPLEIPWWQWIALPLALLVAWLVGKALARITFAIALRIAARTSATWDDELVPRMRGPLVLAWTLVTLRAFPAVQGLSAPAAALVTHVTRGGILLALFWALMRAVDVGAAALSESPWGQRRPAMRSFLPVAARVGKVFVAGMAAVAVLSEMGYPVASLLAGLGIGGLALALAAQKTVENLFGAVAISLDQPIREGDAVKVDGVVGTVEAIGLRSTRIRTLDRTLVSLPNGKLADMRLESYAARDRLRLACDVALEYRTTERQMREVLSGIEGALRAHPKIWPETVVVRFRTLGPSSLDVEVMAWFQTTDWEEFRLIRQEMLLQFMGVVERAGTSFAFPTQTVHLAGPQAPAS